MSRQTWVWDRTTETLVPKEDFYARIYADTKAGPQIMRDIAPYRNVIDGKEIGSRSTHREFLKRNNVVEVGNEKPRLAPRSLPPVPGLRQDIARTLRELKGR